MKRLPALIILSLLLLLQSYSQTTTPNLQMQLPPHAAPNWDSTINADLSLIDSALGIALAPFTGIWSSGTTYSKGQEVTYLGGLYISIAGLNLGNTPSTSPTFWAFITIAGSSFTGTGPNVLANGPAIFPKQVGQSLRADQFTGSDACAQVQACVTAAGVNGTCDATAITGPQTCSSAFTFTNPVNVLFGRAVFTYTGSSVLFTVNARGVGLFGASRGFDAGNLGGLGGSYAGQTVFFLSNTSGSRHLLCTDCDLIDIENISFVGPGINASSGGGIKLNLGSNSNLEGIVVRNVLVDNVTNSCLTINTPIETTIQNFAGILCGNDGIDLFNGGTTTTIIQPLIVTCVGAGIHLENMTAVHVSSGAAESCGIGWALDNSTGVVLDGTDAEVQVDRSAINSGYTGHAYRVFGGSGNVLAGIKSRGIAQSASRHILVTNNAKGTRIISPTIAESGATPAFDVEIDSGSSGTKLDGYDSSAVTISDAGTGTEKEDLLGNITTSAKITLAALATASNCSSSASPAVCSSAAAGSVAIPAGTNPTLVVNTTAITPNSQIQVTVDESLGGRLGVTCNTTTPSELIVTARTAGTSFTVQALGTFTANPVCVGYSITN